jgi:hypothetical protein
MTYPHSHREAQEFFVQRIMDQAKREAIHLSRAEVYMLQWSWADHPHEDETLIEECEKENTEEYKRKIAILIMHAYKEDIRLNNTVKDKYRQAYKALKSANNYLFFNIVDEAIGRHFNVVRSLFVKHECRTEYLLNGIFYGLISLLVFFFGVITLLDAKKFSFELFMAVLLQLIFLIIFSSLTLLNIKKYRRYRKEEF